MIKYQAVMRHDEILDKLTATFIDFPQIIVSDNTKEELINSLKIELIKALKLHLKTKTIITLPKYTKDASNHLSVTLTAIQHAQLLLINELIKSGKNPAQLSRSLKCGRSHVVRLLNLDHKPTIDSIRDALNQLGKTLDMSVIGLK